MCHVCAESPKGDSDSEEVERTVSGVSGLGGHLPDSKPLGGQCPFSNTITASNCHTVRVCMAMSSNTMPFLALGGEGPTRAGLLDSAPYWACCGPCSLEPEGIHPCKLGAKVESATLLGTAMAAAGVLHLAAVVSGTPALPTAVAAASC